MSENNPLVAIVGPTGSGKSDLALELGIKLGGEIVSCDALQIYQELEIGTAKPSPSARRLVAHHVMDCVAPSQDFSAADYISLAVPAIEDIRARGRLPLVVGGTGLYLRALMLGLFDGPGRSQTLRDRLQAMEDRRGPGFLYRLLARWDPPSTARIHRNDRVRLIRALEVRILTGEPMSTRMARRRSPIDEFQVILVGLSPERGALAERIARRAAVMIDSGFTEEVRGLRERYGDDIPAFKAIGYREALDFLDGVTDIDRFRDLLTLATTQYAKRQMTWFRREEGVKWFHGGGDEAAIVDEVLDYLGTVLPRRDLELMHAKTAP